MFGQRLKKLREDANLTQEQFAKKFNILKSSVSMYENNIRIPNIELIKDFASFFNVSIDYLLDYDTTNNIDDELKEKEALKKQLKRVGFMKNEDDLTDDELDKALNFLVANKEFLKGDK